MKKVFARLILALSLAAVIGSSPAPALANGEGLCAANQWPSNLTGQWYYHFNSPASLDDIHGWATSRPLYPCEGLGVNYGFSTIMAANVQDDATGAIFQLGILQVAGQAGEQNYFVRTAGTPQMIFLPSSIRPVNGNRYHFRIYKASTDGQVHYQILDVYGNYIWGYDTGQAWPSTLRHAWWGFETGNSRSAPGTHSANVDLVGQFSYSTSGTIYDAQGIQPIAACYTGCVDDWPFAQMIVSGSNDQIFDVIH